MGQTTDELKANVDSSREAASQKIEAIQDQVMETVHQAEQRVTDTAQQVKEKLDWRTQVEQRPLMAVGAAFIGGILLGNITGKDGGSGQHQYRGDYASPSSGASSMQSGGQMSGLSSSIRNAAKDSGLDDTIQSLANGVFTMLGDRVKGMAEQYAPGIANQMGMSSSSKTEGSSSTSGRSSGNTTADSTSGFSSGQGTGSTFGTTGTTGSSWNAATEPGFGGSGREMTGE
jgi:ElaB/YqjD/DUF883 family membrane-anchored ribosome-binding protein